MIIYHITSADEWQKAKFKNEYLPAGYTADHFIHCSYKEQVAATANRYYSGQTGLILLKIDSSLLRAAVKEENLVGGKELFPHIYGSLPISAVIGTASLNFTPSAGFFFPNGF